jgi:plasmid stability protein
MAQIIVRRLEEEVKTRLREMARQHGRSLESEVREILCDAVKDEGTQPRKLSSEMAALFAKVGLKRGEKIKELRNFRLQVPDFSKWK